MAGLQERANILIEELQEQAGVDSGRDRYIAGYLAAVKDILNTTYEEIEE